MSRRCHTVLDRNGVHGCILGMLLIGEVLPQGSLYPDALLAG